MGKEKDYSVDVEQFKQVINGVSKNSNTGKKALELFTIISRALNAQENDNSKKLLLESFAKSIKEEVNTSEVENTLSQDIKNARSNVFAELVNIVNGVLPQEFEKDMFQQYPNWKEYKESIKEFGAMLTPILELKKEKVVEQVEMSTDSVSFVNSSNNEQITQQQNTLIAPEDLDIDPITKAIREQILTKQRELIAKHLKEDISDPEKFRAYFANEANQEQINEAFKNAELKKALEDVEIAGYKNVHETFKDRFSTMTWQDGTKAENETNIRKQIVKNPEGEEIATLTETTHKLSPAFTVTRSDGATEEIKNYRTINFPIKLDDGKGPMHLSLSAKDKNGNNIAASKAVYFTAHYDENGKLSEVSSPSPLKFHGDGDDGVGYIEHQGQIYTLPVTRAKYQEMMKEVAQNKGQGSDISLKSELAVDTISVEKDKQGSTVEIPKKPEIITTGQDTTVSISPSNENPVVNNKVKDNNQNNLSGENNTKEFEMYTVDANGKKITDDIKIGKDKNLLEEIIVKSNEVSSSDIKNIDHVITLNNTAAIEAQVCSIISTLQESKTSLIKPLKKSDEEIEKIAKDLHDTLLKKDTQEQKNTLQTKLSDKSLTADEQIKMLKALVTFQSDTRLPENSDKKLATIEVGTTKRHDNEEVAKFQTEKVATGTIGNVQLNILIHEKIIEIKKERSASQKVKMKSQMRGI